MKYIIALSLLLSSVAFSYEVKCYSSGVLFYNNESKNIDYREGFIIIKNKDKTEVISADCIISFQSKKT